MDLIENQIVDGIKFCQDCCNGYIRSAIRGKRWRLVYSAGAGAIQLLFASWHFYHLNYFAGVAFSVAAIILPIIHWKMCRGYLELVRSFKRQWAVRRDQWKAELDRHREIKERGFE